MTQLFAETWHLVNMSFALRTNKKFSGSFKEHKLMRPCIRLFEFCRLLYRVNKWKKENGSSAIHYIQSVIKKGNTVVSFGESDFVYSYIILKRLNGTGKLITLEQPVYL